MKVKIFTGPTAVGQVAESLRKISAFHSVLEGTEHVYFNFDGGYSDLLKTCENSSEYPVIRSFLSDIQIL